VLLVRKRTHMAGDLTARGYPLPHESQVAAEDAMRIRTSLEMVDNDIEIIHRIRAKEKLEQTIKLWS